MSSLYFVAAGLCFAIGLAHSVLGERYILIRRFRRTDLPKLFGGTEFTIAYRPVDRSRTAQGMRSDSSSALRPRIPPASPTLRFRPNVPAQYLPRCNRSLARCALQLIAAA